MFVSDSTDAIVTFTLPDGAQPKRYRVSAQGVAGPWFATTSASLTIGANDNAIAGDKPIESRVVDLDVGVDILTQSYLVVSDTPLCVMTNSFSTMAEANAIAATRRDVDAWKSAPYVDRITAMQAAFEILVTYRYFIFYEQGDDWGSRQMASWNLPFSDAYESITSLEDYTAEEFGTLRKDFLKRIKAAQIVAAATIIKSAQQEEHPLDTDPDLLSEKIGDTSRTWRAARTARPIIGAQAVRLLGDYINSTPRLVRT